MSDETFQFFERLRTYAHERAIPTWEPPLGNSIPEGNVPDGFEIGQELRESVEAIGTCGAELLPILGAPLSGQIARLLDELAETVTRIAVVGQIKAGKSSFINALTGRTEFLPTHVNPWTAVPTKLYFGVGEEPQNGARFEFFSEAEWGRLGHALTGPVVNEVSDDLPEAAVARTVWRRALVRLGERYHHLLGEEHRYENVTPKILSHYLCVGPTVEEPSREAKAGRYADITRLAHIYVPARPFAAPTILIDTPGLNDPTFIRIKTTQNILEYADAYIVILTATQPLAFTDIALLRQLRGLEKRRFMVFINRIDELDGGLSDVEAVEAHVRATLRKEFPGSSIAVTSGSALWANAAHDGSEEQLRAMAATPAFRAMAAGAPPRPGIEPIPDIPDDIDALRSLAFEVSGLPALSTALSDLMLTSFLGSPGAKAINVLNSAAEVSASAARRELKTLRELINRVKPKGQSVDFHPGIVQLEKRLQALSEARERITSLIEASQKKIETLCETQSAYIRTSISNTIDAFAISQKALMIRQSGDVRTSRWRCDSSPLLKKLETDFLELFTTTIKDIAAVQEECIGMVMSSIEQPHAAPVRQQKAREPLSLDIRHALAGLGSSINIEIGQPWWLSWWGSTKTRAEKAEELEREIRRQFTPIAERLVTLAQNELSAFAAETRSTIAVVASSTISSTSARLHDLRERLVLHTKQERRQRSETVNRDYADSIRGMLEVIAKCESIMARLRAVAARDG
jgi:hypothetical protein